MAAPSQPITKYDELFDYLFSQVQEECKHVVQARENGLSKEEIDALDERIIAKIRITDKLIEHKDIRKVSKVTMKALRDLMGDELNQYL